MKIDITAPRMIAEFLTPNMLTLIRILLVPILILLMSVSARSLACIVFCLAVSTDYLDGYIAKKYQMTTPVGTFLDPVADKILVSSCLVILTSQSLIPAWLTCALIGREFAVSGLRSIAARNGIMLPASTPAKYKTSIQMLGIFLLMLPAHGLIHVGLACLSFGLVLSLWSGVMYAYELKGIILDGP